MAKIQNPRQNRLGHLRLNFGIGLDLESVIWDLHTATLIVTKDVIPAKAGIQDNAGFRVKPCTALVQGKPGMTHGIGLMSPCINSKLDLDDRLLSQVRQELF